MYSRPRLILFWTFLCISSFLPLINGDKGFGEFCDKVQRCDARAFLSCQNDVCDCLNRNDMTYDSTTQRCLALASRKCKYAKTPIGGDPGQGAAKQFDYADCVPNASCNSEGICVCNNHHVEKPNGACVEQSGFYQPCNSTAECRGNLYLTCLNGTCKCDPATAVDNWFVGAGPTKIRIDRNEHKCVGLADKPCLGGECTKNAVCTKDYMSPGPGTCDCKRGMVKSEDGLCGTLDFDYDASCNVKEKRFCHANFTCIRGKCRCKYSEIHQFYDTVKEICRSFAWGPCDVNATAAQCIDNAVCTLDNLTGLSQCECARGFIENSEGKCDLAFGADCVPGDPFIKCDQMGPLHCRDGKCACGGNLQSFDPMTRKCRGLVGAICKENLPCVHNATCVRRYPSADRGQCQCKEGLKLSTIDRTCA